MTFLVQLLTDIAIVFIVSIPLVVIARRRGRRRHARNFLIGAAIVAFMTTSISVSSQWLVDKCFAAGSSQCQDIGSSGLRMVLLGGFIIVALGEAILVAKD